MDNQHRKIAGYRELSPEEIALMNRIKGKGAELLALQAELVDLLTLNEIALFNAMDKAKSSAAQLATVDEVNRFQAAEPLRWAAIGKTDIQTGIMAMVRAVAQPEGC